MASNPGLDRSGSLRRLGLTLLIGLTSSVPAASAQSGSATANANAGVGGGSGGAAAAPIPAAPGSPRPVVPALPADTEGRTPARGSPSPTPPAEPPASRLAPLTETPASPSGGAGSDAVETPLIRADPVFQPTPGPPGASFAYAIPQRPLGFFAVARDSIFGPSDSAPWQPLPLRSFFTEGWRDAWIAPPNGSGGAPRQGWIGAADGNFYRLYWLSYIEAFHTSGAPNGYTQRINIYTPLSRRFLLITTIPTVNANTPSFNLGTADFGSSGASVRGQTPKGTGTSFGDLTFTPRFMLKETQDLSLSVQLTIQVPTGRTGSGAGKAIISPGLQFWRDIGRGWAVRGAVNSGTGVNNAGRGETIVSQLAIGQTVTPHDTPIFGDFTYYLASNVSNQVAPTSLTTVTLGPGYRTHLGNDWYSLGAVTVPVTGPHPFDESLTLWLMKTF